MAEIIQRDGTWTFDGGTLRLVPGRDKAVSLLRRTLGELTVPLTAVAGVSFEQGRKAGRLRLRLREGADPLLQAAGGHLTDGTDPYQLSVEPDRGGVAEYFVDEVRNALLLDEVPSGPADRYLMAGPSVPLSVQAGDGTASFDGEHVRLEWNWKTEEAKAAAGTRSLAVDSLQGVEWQPSAGLENGFIRFTVRNVPPTKAPPKYDPHAVVLWGFRKDPLMALIAAAVQARLPHPAALTRDTPPKALTAAPAAPPAPAPAPLADDHDALLRRLRELGELREAGVLTQEEFTAAKQAVLSRM
ncbi:DUF4429 domain-containing protein [Streptomyces uncialis]|uniref:Tat pathway signal sequence domain protein n=1 Tax=Streptomyces uncialis TaxID=1048205 RepID=A0A1Q4UZV8_9ACTN|nr:DUF4429 domain-containing protein [Streptomyces uncialis]MCX4664016.1 DUF4429 domain-containing protein [Streptomyces uncialis]OKH91155.1 Tat pathway signal sequence domain protein [Streptomyces uncialis]WST70308.1 DUF4429 domain-containing protein [Streptomyces uncialis]WTE10996.1 DUF4429 domain-containing protein [Streptomyces uncialis]